MLQQLYDFITQHNLLQEITTFFQNLKNHGPEIIIFFILLIILYSLIKLINYLFNRQTCIKCDKKTRKIWLKINSNLGICYRCIAGNLWETKLEKFTEKLEQQLDQITNQQKQEK
jgi:hypothetical protein